MREKQFEIEDIKTNVLLHVLARFIEENYAAKVIEGTLLQQVIRSFNKLMSCYLKEIK